MLLPSTFPVLRNDPVFLRAFTPADAPAVAALANDPRIFQMTLLLPYPYELEHAAQWIGGHDAAYKAGKSIDWAITLATDARAVGAIGLTFDDSGSQATIGYWLGAAHWGQGLCTAAGLAVVDFVFAALDVLLLTSFVFVGNDASARVLRKIGLHPVGLAPAFVNKLGKGIDCERFALTQEDWMAARTGKP